MIKENKPPQDTYYFGLLVADRSVVAVFKPGRSSTIVTPADINVLLNFLAEHNSKLRRRAPCFFNVCVPGLSEGFKMSVFFHTSCKQPSKFGLRLLIVTEEASA